MVNSIHIKKQRQNKKRIENLHLNFYFKQLSNLQQKNKNKKDEIYSLIFFVFSASVSSIYIKKQR